MTRTLLACLFVCAAARAEVTNCTAITAVPITIATPGIYCLTGSITTNNPTPITISASDVVLDFNGFTLTGANIGTGVIISSASNLNVVIRNGTIRTFTAGISLRSNGGVVEKMLVQSMRAQGILVSGAGAVVRNNRVQDIGSATTSALGISVSTGANCHVHDNEVLNIIGSTGTSPWGIEVLNSPGTVVQRNVVSRVLGSGGSTVYGIVFNNTTGNVAAENRVYGFDHGIAWLSPSTGLYRDNTVGGATTPYSGGVAAGTTNSSF